MNKEQFLTRLEKLLRRIPKDERDSILDYYREYFEEAGAEREQDVIQELVSPEQVAADTIGEFVEKELDKTDSKRGIRTVWITILAIFASPVAIPIAICMVTILLVLLVCVFAIIVSIGATAIGMIAMGILTTIVALMVLVSDPATALFFIGIGLAVGSLGMAVAIFTIWLSKKSFRGLTKLAKKFLSHRRNKNV